MRLREVFLYEIAHRVRAPSTWAYGGFLFLGAFWILGATADVGAVNINAPEDMARGSLALGLLGLLVTAALFGDAAVRDARAGMDPLLFTSRIHKAEYLGGRFLAALASNSVLALAIPTGLAAATLLGFPEPEGYGPFRLAAHVQPYLLFVLPNVIFSGAVLFTVGVLSRQMIPVYLSAIGLFISYLVTVNVTIAVETPLLAALADPIGIRALSDFVELWTTAERNTQLIGFPAGLVWNRAVWLTLGVATLTGLYRAFEFAHPDGGGRQRKVGRVVFDPEPVRSPAFPVPRAAGSFSRRTTARQTIAVVSQSLGEIVASRWFIVVLAACTGLTMLWGWNVAQTVFETATWPVTMLIAGTVLSQRAIPLLFVLTLLYAGELVWKDREAGFAEIADAAPVPAGAALVGRFLALVALIVMMQTAALVGGLLIQTLQGYYAFEFGLYIRTVFGVNLPGLVLWAALVLTIHVVVNHKNLGHLVSIMVMLFLAGIGRALGFRHHLVLYGTDPGWIYSDMNGFGPYVEPFVWFKLYWSAWALLLMVVAGLFWVRGREPGLRSRFRQARQRLAGPALRLGGLAIGLIASLGGFIFYNTNVLHEYVGADEVGALQAELERRYGHYEAVPQPIITDAELHVEIYPNERAVDIRGTYHLVNPTDASLDSIHVFLPETEARSFTFDRGADSVLVDEEMGYRIYALDAPLEPGGAMRLDFDVGMRVRGFPNNGIPTEVVANGAYFGREWLPFIGYQPILELTNAAQRARFGLDPQPPAPGPDDLDARRHRYSVRDADRVNLRTTIGTSLDQIAVASGMLRRSWEENGRQYFHYETDSPVSFGAAVFSGEYAELKDEWNGVELKVLHHPGHRFNLESTMESMKASLAYLSANFGPYQGSQLRVVEIPRYGVFGRAHPNTVAFQEDFFFSRYEEGDIDQAFYGTAHEVAHMWWGGQARSAHVTGAGFVSESLANYSATMVVENTHGREIANRIYDFHMDRYLRGRAFQGREVPLLEVEDQSYIAYRKGAIAMLSLRERLGEATVNGALEAFIRKYADAGPPYPTALDLYAELQAVTPDSLRPLLTDLFETVTLWDVEARQATVRETETGEFEVTLDVRARKVRADRDGNEVVVPMDDAIQIGLFVPGEDDAPDLPLYLERHRIVGGEQTIRVVVPREPSYAAIDPYNRLIDRNRSDNLVRIGSN